MRRTLSWAMVAALAVTGLTACSVGDDGTASRVGRAAALVNAGPLASARMQLTIAGLTPEAKAIEVISYSWGVETGRPVGFSNLTITKTMDETSPLLFRGAATAARYTNAELKLTLGNNSGQQAQYLTYALENVLVKSVQPGVERSGTATLHVEDVVLAYETILEVVTANHEGSITPVRFGWDLGEARALE